MIRKPDRRMLICSAWTLIFTRQVLVETRTELKRHVNTLVWGIGDRLWGGLNGNLPRYAERFLPEGTRIVAEPTLAAVRSIGWRIANCEHRIEEVADLHFPETRYLRSYPEIDARTALSFVLVIDDPRRFRSSRSVGPYLYLVEARPIGMDRLLQRSGEDARREFVGGMLVDTAKRILSPAGVMTDLKRWGLGLAARKGPQNRSGVLTAVARKLSTVLHRLWITRQMYRTVPLNEDEVFALGRAQWSSFG